MGFLVPLWMLLNLGQYGVVHLSREDFAYAVYQVVAVIVPGLTFGYAILCAMMVWSYLYSARSVGLMHALPIDRTCLFVTNTLSGLAMMLIPYVTTGILVCLIALGWGFLNVAAADNVHVQVLVNVGFHAAVKLIKEFIDHAIPVSFFFINIGVGRDGEFAPGFNGGFGTAHGILIGDAQGNNQAGTVFEPILSEDIVGSQRFFSDAGVFYDELSRPFGAEVNRFQTITGPDAGGFFDGYGEQMFNIRPFERRSEFGRNINFADLQADWRLIGETGFFVTTRFGHVIADAGAGRQQKQEGK